MHKYNENHSLPYLNIREMLHKLVLVHWNYFSGHHPVWRSVQQSIWWLQCYHQVIVYSIQVLEGQYDWRENYIKIKSLKSWMQLWQKRCIFYQRTQYLFLLIKVNGKKIYYPISFVKGVILPNYGSDHYIDNLQFQILGLALLHIKSYFLSLFFI